MAFKDFSKYRFSKFSRLDEAIPDKSEQTKFINWWAKKYALNFKDNPPEEAYLWNIRVHKALKESFSSAYYYTEALIAKQTCSWASFYFLSYYSLFHALLSCVYMLPSESLHGISEITHTKLINVFTSAFCVDPFPIINDSIKRYYFLLKYSREYYSYHMPPNQFFYEHKDLVQPDVILGDILIPCLQLSSLLSEIIERSYEKNKKKIDDPSSYYWYVRENYCLVNSQKHPFTNDFLLHYVDRVRLDETVKYPAPIAHVIEFEHYDDEFLNYGFESRPLPPNGEVVSPSAFVYRAIIGG